MHKNIPSKISSAVLVIKFTLLVITGKKQNYFYEKNGTIDCFMSNTYSIGAGEASDILNTRTKGSKPIMPENSKFIEPSSNSVTLHLPTWKDGSCRMSHFVVEHKKK